MSVKMHNLIDGNKSVVVRRCECRNVPMFIDNTATKNGYTIRCPNCGRKITSYVSELDVANMWNDSVRGYKNGWG